jgi:hypothetical protein
MRSFYFYGMFCTLIGFIFGYLARYSFYKKQEQEILNSIKDFHKWLEETLSK